MDCNDDRPRGVSGGCAQILFALFAIVSGANVGSGRQELEISWTDRSRIEDAYHLKCVDAASGYFGEVAFFPGISGNNERVTHSYFEMSKGAELGYTVYAQNEYGASAESGFATVIPDQILRNRNGFELILLGRGRRLEGQSTEIRVQQVGDGGNRIIEDSIWQFASSDEDVLPIMIPVREEYTGERSLEQVNGDSLRIKVLTVRPGGDTIEGDKESDFFELFVDIPSLEIVSIDSSVWHSNRLGLGVRLEDGDNDELETYRTAIGSDWTEVNADGSGSTRFIEWHHDLDTPLADEQARIRYTDGRGGACELEFRLLVEPRTSWVTGMTEIPIRTVHDLTPTEMALDWELVSSDESFVLSGPIDLAERIGSAGFSIRPEDADAPGACDLILKGHDHNGILKTVLVTRVETLPQLYYSGFLQGLKLSKFLLAIRHGGYVSFLNGDAKLGDLVMEAGVRMSADGRFFTDLDRISPLAPYIETVTPLETFLGWGTIAADQSETLFDPNAIAGQFTDTGYLFSGQLQPTDGTTSRFAGLYNSTVLLSSNTSLDVVVGHDGLASVYLQTAVVGELETFFQIVPVDENGRLSIDLRPAALIDLSLEPSDRSLTGTIEFFGREWDVVAGPESTFEPSGLSNLSLRAFLDTSSREIITGFVVEGDQSLNVLIRGVGPGLGAYGVPDFLADPVLKLRSFNGDLIGLDDDWSVRRDRFWLADLTGELGAFSLQPESLDSVLHESVSSGGYTALLSSGDGSEGEVLIEVYNASHRSETRLVNMSTRLKLSTDGSAILGFLIAEGVPRTLLVRAVGPGLEDFGVSDFMADPFLELSRSSDSSFGPLLNADWGDTEPSVLEAAFRSTGAFPLRPGSKDAAMLLTLDPGAYTARITGQVGESGIVLIELFVVDER